MMASDYEAIKANNKSRYGTDVGRYGKSLLTDLYDDRTHFIYELLQNAEDALRRRDNEPRSRMVRFNLSRQALRISHYGKPFDQRDVEGICGIARSTREGDLTRIGRFGIGFKSVYGFTRRPEIHSGGEDFGIDSFVWPSAQPAIERDPDQTVFVMPLRDAEENSAEITEGLQRINLDTLLFLREIDTIEWSLPSGEFGTYVRQSDDLDEHVRRVTVIGESKHQSDAERSWLVFSKPAYGKDDVLAGYIEIAFLLQDERIIPTSRSPLVVFFPTVVETHLGFRVQGPYRTTPSRDNVPKNDAWNQECVEKTGDVLVDACVWLRDRDRLDVNVLQCLPIDQSKFDDDSRFTPLYEKVKDALRSKDLLPVFGGGHAAARSVKLARTQELRELFDRKQLKRLFDSKHPMSWLIDSISQDRTPDLRQYLMDDLDIDEITPQAILPRLRKSFLKHQSNRWMNRLYEFLKGQLALHQQAKEAPIIRRSDGKHVPAFVDDIPQAYLPGKQTNFHTVHPEACSTDGSRQFLMAIGLSLPDPVDDIIQNVLPKYCEEDIDVDDADYEKDIARIVDAFQTDSTARRAELVDRLSKTNFLYAVDAENEQWWKTPEMVYFKTDRLASLFDGVEDVLFVDPSYECLRGEKVRSMLEACGTSRYLRREEVPCKLPHSELKEIRRKAGLERSTWGSPSDFSLRGVDELLDHMASLPADERRSRAATLWDALSDVASHIPGAFEGTYKWSYYQEYKSAEFDASFVRRLNEIAWVPTEDGEFRVPAEVSFETLGWRPAPFLLSKIRFRPAEIDLLAEKVDIEAEVLYLLKEHGLTNMAAVRDRLGLPEEEEDDEASSGDSVADAIAALGVTAPSAPSNNDPSATQDDAERVRGIGAHSGCRRENAGVESGRRAGGTGSGLHPGANKGATASNKAGSFISYIAVDQEGSADDPDGLVHEERIELEKAAIDLILNRESNWQQTPPNNEGFDLFKVANGQPCVWCEVKAMTGSLQDRPVGLSRAQFDLAREHGDAYWLYVVEQAAGKDARIVRIQDPAGKAKTFTFDKGWLDVAKAD